MKKRTWSIIILLAVVGVGIYLWRKAREAAALVDQKLGSNGIGGHKPPRVGRGEPNPGPDPDQPAQNPPGQSGKKSKVVITFSQIAAIAPLVAAPIAKGLTLNALSSVLGYTGKGTGYTEPGIRQISKANISFGTWVKMTILGISQGLKLIQSEGSTGAQGGSGPLTPKPPEGGSGYGGYTPPSRGGMESDIVALLRDARTQVAFEVDCPPESAVSYFLGSALNQDIAMGEELTALLAQFANFEGSLIKLLSTKASKA
jgi:hypothetical protein